MTTSQTANRVRVACPCGKKYRCRPEAIGKTFRCRACGDSVEAVAVRQNDKSSPPSDCPGCGEGLLQDASFCLLCGHDLETGQNLLPQTDMARREPAGPVAARRKKGRPKRKVRRKNSRVGSDGSARVSDAEDVPPSQSWLPSLWLVGGASALVGISHFLQAGMSGRWFLVFYGAVLAGCWGFSEWNRDRNDAWFPFGVAIATFLGVGVARFNYGINHGMGKFALLIFLMFAGTTLIAVGVNAVSGKETAREIKVYGYLPGISIALSLACLLWTVIGPVVILVPILLYSLIFGRHNSYGSSGGGCGGGGGGCGGGGCGGCGG